MSSDKVFELDPRVSKKSYIITYSQADAQKFPTRQSFADAVLEVFSKGKSKVAVKQWVCCIEKHQLSGFHYHMAILFSGNKRWLSAKKFLMERYGISVHFSDEEHYNYYSAYRYVTKEDGDALLSPGHQDLSLGHSPQTSKSSRARMRGSSTKRKSDSGAAESSESPAGPSRQGKHRRLSNLDVAEFVVKEGIEDDISLLAMAKEQKEVGKMDLANFVFSRNSKSRQELIESAWKMQNAPDTIARSKLSRMDIVNEAASGACSEGCNGLWLTSARELLKNNGVNAYIFEDAIRQLLLKGRGKHRNIMIVGPANCGKTFLLDPLNELFSTFTNPATTSYAWLGAENADIIFLNDFRYSADILSWKDMLLLLEGQAIHFAAPKSTYAKDILFNRDTPIFATSKEPIRYPGRYNTTDERENEMMDIRWKFFRFYSQIAERDVKVIPICKRCFSELVLLGMDV